MTVFRMLEFFPPCLWGGVPWECSARGLNSLGTLGFDRFHVETHIWFVLFRVSFSLFCFLPHQEASRDLRTFLRLAVPVPPPPLSQALMTSGQEVEPQEPRWAKSLLPIDTEL